MNTKLLIFVFLLFLIYFFTISAFAQTAPGGVTGCATSISVKRNNGNGHGVCNGDAQLRVIFSPMPSPENIPLLTGIFYQGQSTTKVTLPIAGDMVTDGQGYVSYCVVVPLKNNGNQFGKISPSIKIALEFTYQDGTICRTDVVN
ncbi:MAG TPA: hypothetical protein VIM07_15830 [Chitinophagaceae bacterium]